MPGLTALWAWPDVPVQLLGILIDTLAAGLVCWIGRTSLGWKTGLIAGLLYALFPPLAFDCIRKVPCGWLSFCIASFLACTLCAVRSSGRRSVAWLLLAGIAVGVGGYLRPDYIFVPVFLTLGVWAYTRRLWQSVAAMAFVQVIALIVLLPWAYHNYLAVNRWIFTSTSVGPTLVTGLAEFSNPWEYQYGDYSRVKQARAVGISYTWGSDADLYFRKLFLSSIKERPLGYVVAVLKRIPLALATPFWYGYENPYKEAFCIARFQAGTSRERFYMLHWKEAILANWQFIPTALFTLACSASVVVMFIKEWPRAGLILLLLSPHIYSMIAHVLTHFEERFILPSMFCWILALGYVLAKDWRFRGEIPHRTRARVSRPHTSKPRELLEV